MIRLTANVNVDFRLKEAQARGDGFGRAFAAQMASITHDRARDNVAPGRGPGPHPHRVGSDHVDSGELMDSIQTAEESRGRQHEAAAYTDKEYGPPLELGWHTAAGTFYRYPFLGPALDEARQEAVSVAKTEGRTRFG